MPDTITLTVSPGERAVFLAELWRWTTPGDPVPFDTREEAVRVIDDLQRAFRLTEELGWDLDESRRSFTVTIDEAVVKLLRVTSKDAHEMLESDSEHRAKAAAGDPDYWHVGTETIEAVLAQYDEQIRRHEYEISACDDMLARLARDTGDAMLAVTA